MSGESSLFFMHFPPWLYQWFDIPVFKVSNKVMILKEIFTLRTHRFEIFIEKNYNFSFHQFLFWGSSSSCCFMPMVITNVGYFPLSLENIPLFLLQVFLFLSLRGLHQWCSTIFICDKFNSVFLELALFIVFQYNPGITSDAFSTFIPRTSVILFLSFNACTCRESQITMNNHTFCQHLLLNFLWCL